jgi:serine phosphatase RsbU (regulator of sigma subunit)
MPLGLLSGEFTEHVITLCHDFRLLFYADGISEALDQDNQEFGSCRLADFVATHDCSAKLLLEQVRNFSAGGGLTDDATLILLRSA